MPYAKKQKQKRPHTIVWAVAIVVTLLAMAAAGWCAFQMYREDQALRARLIEEATPRIAVPASYFQSPAAPQKPEVPKRLAAIRLEPGTDFYTDPALTEEQVSAELDTALAQVHDLGMNAILVDTRLGDKVIYSSGQLASAPVDALKLLCDKAGAMGLQVHATFPMEGVSLADGSKTVSTHLSEANRTTLVAAARELAAYPIKTLQLEDYYLTPNGAAYAAFVEDGEPGNFDNWLKTMIPVALERLRAAVREVNPALPVGLVVSSVWANQDTAEDGSATSGKFQALTDGYADTRAYVLDHLVDFVNVSVSTSRGDPAVPFGTAVKWWGALCQQSGTPLYVTQCGENAGGDQPGWNGMDELLRQTILAEEAPDYCGSIYTGLAALVANPDGSTAYLEDYLAGKVSKTDAETDLTVSIPAKFNTVTYEEKQQFRMKFDPNQEVYLNGEKLTPTERGGVSIWLDLKVGPNTFTLEHKGRKLTYNVERKVIIFDSVSPTKDMKVAGGSTLEFNVKAYKGSTISATLGGKTVQLTEGGGEGDQLDSSYVNYVGSMTLPSATAKEQPLGKISFYGKFDMYEESKSGAAITVDKRPDEVDPDEMTGQVYTQAVVTDDYAYVYPYKTTPEFPEAILTPLPKGTQDVVVSRSGDYLNLRSGKTVKLTTGSNNNQAEVSLQDLEFPGNNQVTAMQMGVEGNETVIRMSMLWRAPFSVQLNNYPTSTGTTKRSDYDFNSTQVTILLDYTTTIADGVVSGSLDGSPLFSGVPSMERVRNDTYGIWQYKLTLPLNRPGRYYGCQASWEGNDLVLRFKHPPTDGGTLDGVRIVVDPGHGGTDTGTTAGADVLEKDVNLLQAQAVADALQSLGAQVYMIRTGDESVDVYDRPRIANAYDADMYLSIHHNSAGWNSAPHGVEVYYNTPFSEPLGYYVHQQLAQYISDRGFWTKNFLVARETSFPSLLIEFGYLSNPGDEAMALDPNHRADMARGVAQGVLNYYMAYN